MEIKKIKYGQFFTKESFWLRPQIEEFIKNTHCKIAYDPFAGGGDLLKVAKEKLGFQSVFGLDIDESLNWKSNDSLLQIPHIDDAIIITNPPYIAKQSASRKGIDLSIYFAKSHYDDIYLIALDKMLEAQKYIVAIIPESFINSSFLKKNFINSITILEDNPFEDTENPVCAVCFDGEYKKLNKIKIYKNDDLVGDFGDIESIRISPNNDIKITFNTLEGWLGLRAIDSTDDKTFIHFDYKENFKYDWNSKIKVSSRHYSLINIDVPKLKRNEFISECNLILKNIREQSSDILLTPFKGNTKSGIRRRRLDFKLARAIMEVAYKNVCSVEYGQQKLF